MCYFLILIGIIFIVLGITDKESLSVAEVTPEPEVLKDLVKRIEDLEKTLYDVDLNFEEEEIELFESNFSSVASKIDISDEPITIFDTLRQCEKEGYSLEKICLKLNMNKGEVLLLKNLYKNYQA